MNMNLIEKVSSITSLKEIATFREYEHRKIQSFQE